MLYKLLLYPARIALYFYCRSVTINNKAALKAQGPLLIAANHPNSFLDAIILSSLFKYPICSLARGDAFTGKFISRLLSSLHILPVYRVSEGVENLESNYATFDACLELFRQNKIVLIFSEGRCINEWHLRPLKKGTARLALAAWQQGIPLKVMPLGINYSSFKFFGKNIILRFGEAISPQSLPETAQNGRSILLFNTLLEKSLKEGVYEIDSHDRERQKELLYVRQPLLKKAILFLPALAGFIIYAPLYTILHLLIRKRSVDHYDSVMAGLLFFLFPLYIFAITLVTLLITGKWIALLLPVLLLFTAWSYLQLKRQIK